MSILTEFICLELNRMRIIFYFFFQGLYLMNLGLLLSTLIIERWLTGAAHWSHYILWVSCNNVSFAILWQNFHLRFLFASVVAVKIVNRLIASTEFLGPLGKARPFPKHAFWSCWLWLIALMVLRDTFNYSALFCLSYSSY